MSKTELRQQMLNQRKTFASDIQQKAVKLTNTLKA